MARKSYYRSIFINCPIDNDYRQLFYAIVFTIIRCDYYPRCAEEESDSSEIRLYKILRMVGECKYSVNDISRTKLDRRTKYPRFNMPFELGIFVAAKHFGYNEQNNKNCLIFEKQSHSYEKYISDIKGQDIETHNNKPQIIICKIRNWICTNSLKKSLPSGSVLCKEYQRYQKWLPSRCKLINKTIKELTYWDYAQLVYEWIEKKV